MILVRMLMWPIWWFAVALTILTSTIWGFLPSASGLVGAASADDRLTSTGGYASGAIVLLLAATALKAFRGPANARRLSIGCAALFTLLAVRGALTLRDPKFDAVDGWDSFWHGAAGALMTPWSWFFVAAGVLGWARLVITPIASPELLGRLTRTATMSG